MISLIRLIPTPYLIIGIALVLAVTHGTAGYAGWKLRDNAARAELQKETEARLKQAEQLNQEIQRLHREARAAEAEHANRLASVSKTFQERLKNVRDEKDKFVAAVRSGAIRLRIPTTSPAPADRGAAKAGTTACRCDAAAGTELPREVAEFLWGEASRADEVVEQLNACQAIVLEDRRVCGTN